MTFRDRRNERASTTQVTGTSTSTTAPPDVTLRRPSVPVYEVTWNCEKGWGPVMMKGYTSAPFAWYKTYGFKGSGMCIYAVAADKPPAVPHHLLPCEGC
jgi:hypothetical protein